MQTTIITHEGHVEMFDVLVMVSEPDEHGLRSVRAVEVDTYEVWFDGEWNGQVLNADDPEAVARLVVEEVAA